MKKIVPITSRAPHSGHNHPRGSESAAEGQDPLHCLLNRTALGDEKAFAHLYHLTSPKLFSFAQGITGRADLAEDVLQECFLRVWRVAYRYDPQKGRPMTWLMTIIRNCALTIREKHSKFSTPNAPFLDVSQHSAAITPLEQAMMSFEAQQIRVCLQNLPSNHRRAIELSFFHGLAHRELAAVLNVPLGTAKSWIRRGLSRMRPCLGFKGEMSLAEAVAAEYSVGALPPDLRTAFARRREKDARYCTAADQWEEKLAPFLEHLRDRPPPLRVWRKIERNCRRSARRLSRRSDYPLWTMLISMLLGVAAFASYWFYK